MCKALEQIKVEMQNDTISLGGGGGGRRNWWGCANDVVANTALHSAAGRTFGSYAGGSAHPRGAPVGAAVGTILGGVYGAVAGIWGSNNCRPR